MNNITSATVRTMTSREIAAIAEKRHDNVMRVCRDLRDTGVCPQIEETPYIEPTNGQTYTQCLLNQRDSYVVMARLSPEFTARLVDRWQELESGAAMPIAAAAPKLLPIDLLEQAQALKTLLGDDELKRLAPLLWQDITDGAQNAMRRALGAPLALPAPDAPKLLDVVEIAKAAGIDLPQNLRGAAGKYVKARVAHVETERIIAGSIRKSAAYCDHAAVADALREYLGKRAASQSMLG